MDRYMLFPSGMGQHQNGSYVLFADAQATIAALQADIKAKDSRIWELESWLQVKSPQEITLMESKIIQLEHQLTQRTAELEALRKWRDYVTVSLQRPGGVFFVDVPQHIKDLVKERDDLRTLVAALPKVEGAVVVSNGYVKDSTRCHALFGADEDAASYAALLQHRQRVEG